MIRDLPFHFPFFASAVHIKTHLREYTTPDSAIQETFSVFPLKENQGLAVCLDRNIGAFQILEGEKCLTSDFGCDKVKSKCKNQKLEIKIAESASGG